MQKLTIRRISLASLIKLLSTVGLCLGFVFGLLILVVGLLGGNAYANLGSTTITGPMAGVIGLPLSMVLFGLGGVFGGLVGYLPVRWLLRLLGGLNLELDLPQSPEDQQTA